MSSDELWASIEAGIELCAHDHAGLSHPIHFDYETYEPPGTQAFDALLALIELLPAEEQLAAVALAQERLKGLPAHRRREIVTDRTLPILATSPAWPLIRSVTFTGSEGGSGFVAAGEPRLSSLEHIGLRDPLGSEAVECLSHLSQFGSLRSIESEGNTRKRNEPLSKSWVETLQRLTSVVTVDELDLAEVPRWQLRKAELRASARAVELLNERNAGCLRELELSAFDDDADAALEALLETRPLLSGLTTLSISLDLTDDQFARLVTCPELAQLERLEIRPFIGPRAISPTAVEALVHAPFLPRLTTLSLCDQPLTPLGWQGLSRVPFERLTSLDLKRTKGGEAGMAALVGAHWLAGVRDLDLTDCDIGPNGAAALASAENTANLVSLKMGGNGIHNKGPADLAVSPHLRNLREIEISNMGLWGFGELSHAGWFHQLESILVTAVQDGSDVDALQAFAASGEFPNLVSFKFGYHATDEGLRSLAQAQNMPRLRRLVLQHNSELTARGIEALVSSPLLHKIWELNFDHCPIGDGGAKLLAAPGVFRELVKLNVWNYGGEITLAGSTALAYSEVARTVRWLSINRDLLQPWLESLMVSPLLRARLAEYVLD